jgi:16S rRNA (cytosine1402-N4)-methyltransferase
MAYSHEPVMLERCMEVLEPAAARPGAVAVDATVGLGGHSLAMLRRFPELHVIGVDRDPQALHLANERLAGYGDRVRLRHAVYDDIDQVLADLGVPSVDAILFDLGVSSMQLDAAERGFAYAQDAPLDMRMDPTTGVPAAEVVNTYDENELTRILRRYGEERFARRIAAAIVRERASEPLTSTRRLADLVRASIPAATRRTGGHPAKRTFQALRIEVNGELDVLERAIPTAMDLLTPGGRVVVLTYHSLEDRIVKHAFAERSRSSAPPGLPVELPEHAPRFRVVARGEEPSDHEIETNPRSASARLRAVERMAAA